MAGSLAQAVIGRYVEQRSLAVAPGEAAGAVWEVEERHGSWACALTPFPEEEVVLIESVAPLRVPPEKFRSVAELLTLINDELLVGAFVADRQSGIVRFKVAVDVEALAGTAKDPSAIGAAMIASPVATNIATMDRWLAAISVVVHGDTVPSDAVEAIRSRP